MPLSLKLRLAALLCFTFLSITVALAGYLQLESAQGENWISLVRLLGGGAVGIICILAITRLIQALKNQPLDGHQVTLELTKVISKLDLAITVMNTTTRNDHDRMLQHDIDFTRRLESISANEAIALSNHRAIIDAIAILTKTLDRIESNQT